MNNRVVLILEGGGMRGLYGAGVLEIFATKKLEFDEIIGVSMGACNGCNYISKQPKRNISIPMNFVNDKRYLSFTRFLFGGELFGMDFIFKTIPEELDKFDYETFKKNRTKLTIVATNCITGKPEYFNLFESKEEFLSLLRSSCALPFIAKPIKYKNEFYMDGGISDPIPLHYAQNLQAKKIILVLTQPSDYIKNEFLFNRFLSFKYPNFKGLCDAMKNRHNVYNKIMKEIALLEEKGEIFVIRPKNYLHAKRVDRSKKRIMDTYIQGVKDASKVYEKLEKFLHVKV